MTTEDLLKFEQELIAAGVIKQITEKDTRYRKGLNGLRQVIKAAGDSVREKNRQIKKTSKKPSL